MKHAIMIVAHKNKEQLVRLARSFSPYAFDVFIHIDKKAKFTNAEMNEIKQCSENVYVLDKRISGVLDTWSLVEIAIELMMAAKGIEQELGVKYSYFALLSGQDYPIKSSEYIESFLRANYPKPLIDCTPYAKGNWVYKKFNSVGFHKVSSHINARIGKGMLRRVIKLPFFISAKLFSVYKKTRNKIKSPYNYDLYGGSAWWILPDKVIDFIFSELENNYNEIKKYKSTLTPEETFFQIMTMASPLSDMVDVNDPRERSQNCMTYAHFTGAGKPFMGHPYILVKEDFNMIKELPHLIARKFDTNVDNEILDLIDLNNR